VGKPAGGEAQAPVRRFADLVMHEAQATRGCLLQHVTRQERSQDPASGIARDPGEGDPHAGARVSPRPMPAV
jgi:hypothetical protein